MSWLVKGLNVTENMGVKRILGAVRGRKYLDRLDRTKILRKGDNTSA
jgi:hypothetical protein